MADVIVERRGEAAWIRLNRPERRNAYDLAMAEELTAAVRSSADAAAIVITGSDGAFCAGGFLADLSDPDVEELRVLFDGLVRLTLRSEVCPAWTEPRPPDAPALGTGLMTALGAGLMTPPSTRPEVCPARTEPNALAIARRPGS